MKLQSHESKVVLEGPESLSLEVVDLSYSYIGSRDISNCLVQEEDGNIIRVEELMLCKDIDRIRNVLRGSVFTVCMDDFSVMPDELPITQFASSSEKQKEILEFLSPYFVPRSSPLERPNSSSEGSYSVVSADTKVVEQEDSKIREISTGSTEQATSLNLSNEFFCIEEQKEKDETAFVPKQKYYKKSLSLQTFSLSDGDEKIGTAPPASGDVDAMAEYESDRTRKWHRDPGS